MNRKQIMLELANERSAIQITELKEEIEHLKSKLQQIEQLADELVQTKIPFCQIHEQIKEIVRGNNNDR